MADKSSKKHFLAELEEQMLALWDSEDTFKESLKHREGSELFNFYDGPPFANGLPHYGHLVQTTIKDSVTRYKTMRGYYVPRRVGWDTHGLPVEYAIEKEHGFKGKQDIVKYGIDKFNAECRESVFAYKDVWEQMFRRVGRWADYEKTYATLDEGYIESVWWVFKTIYDKGLIYKDFRSSPYCPRCATPLSNFELNQGYQDNISDPSLFVKFRLENEDAFMLAWTTTPWSLPGNAALAVDPMARYAYVEINNDQGEAETLILAQKRLSVLDKDTYQIVKEVKGEELVGKHYEPLFKVEFEGNRQLAYQIYGAGSIVSLEDGTGVLHVAPAFGEDDLTLGKTYSLPVLISIDENGHVRKDLGLPEEFAGKFFKAADQHIIAYLTKQNRVYAAETFTHTYPFCWRCDTPLLYYATDSWVVKVTALKDSLIKNNQDITWVPSHIQNGRFGKWLENARDWAISRNRFWGAPLPIWMTDDGEVVVIGSLSELKELAVEPDKVKDLHKPYIDDVKIKTKSGKIASRIPEVFDCWFESGSMPYAQDHYPFENKEKWEQSFPAHFIAEAIDQTRGWFYTLHVLASALFDKPAFKDVICSGWVVAADGEKLSKRKKNYAPMDEVFDQFGVDTLRYFMASSPIVNGEDVRFSVDYLRDVQRKVFMTLNNVYSFYKLYADVDKWVPVEGLIEPEPTSLLDLWVLSRLNETIKEVTESMDNYRLDKATRPISDLLDDVSNWFVRRSRRRFWKSDDDKDKQQAYETLHYTILRLCQLLAPFSPFLSDYIWRELTNKQQLPKSVHLSDWPVAGEIDQKLLNTMKLARDYLTEGLSQRAEAKVKVRQPLPSVTVPELPDGYKDIIADELNVKQVIWSTGGAVKVDTVLTPALIAEGSMRELVRQIQGARKKAELNVEDRIRLNVVTEDTGLRQSITEHIDTIKAETLATEFGALEGGYQETIKVNGVNATIHILKI